MSNRSFFEESRDQSLVKAKIVAKYFWAWAKVMLSTTKTSHKKIGYVDLFSGPGRYNDDSKSTPLLILEQAIQDSEMKQRLVTIFNDVDSNHTQALEQAINSLDNIDQLTNQPRILNEAVGAEIIQKLDPSKSLPTLFFIDPWGYKGLSLRLIGSLIMSWGCDCIFFFNYNRINMGLNNAAVVEHMNALFGEERANQLRKELESKSPFERELMIVEAISQALKEIGGEYVLPFRFKNETGERTSHHLIFVSKHVLGYSMMKEIMAKESSSNDQGVASFEYNPSTIYNPIIAGFSRTLDELEDMLLDEFAGQTLPMIEIYNPHHVGKRYIKKNYKDVLIKLESERKITTNPSKRKPNTLADHVEITFPAKL